MVSFSLFSQTEIQMISESEAMLFLTTGGTITVKIILIRALASSCARIYRVMIFTFRMLTPVNFLFLARDTANQVTFMLALIPKTSILLNQLFP